MFVYFMSQSIQNFPNSFTTRNAFQLNFCYQDAFRIPIWHDWLTAGQCWDKGCPEKAKLCNINMQNANVSYSSNGSGKCGKISQSKRCCSGNHRILTRPHTTWQKSDRHLACDWYACVRECTCVCLLVRSLQQDVSNMNRTGTGRCKGRRCCGMRLKQNCKYVHTSTLNWLM